MIMDELKISIDIGTKDIAERTTMVANKYKLDNERLHNDLHGFKQRTEKEKIELKDRANERVIKSLMNTLYNIDELGKYRDKSANYTVGDMGGIKDNIYDIIKNEGVDIINPSIGDNFDDKKCCAIKTIETDKFPDNRIMDIKKIGCMFKSGKVINYADVIVSKSSVKVEAVKADTKVDTKVDVKTDTKAQIETNKTDTKAQIEAAKIDAKAQIEAAKIDVKTDAKAQIETNKTDTKAQIEAAKIDAKVDTKVNTWAKIEVDKVDTKTDTKTGIQVLIEYIETKIFGKADNNEQNKKDENNEVYITPEFKKKGD
jgi:molecular chaperone GrpE (heat shock protein)